MITQNHVNQILNLVEEKGYETYPNSTEITILHEQDAVEQLPPSISNELLNGVGSVTSNDTEEVVFKDYIYLYPNRTRMVLRESGVSENYLTGMCIQLLLHEIRHHVQKIELIDYLDQYFDDYRKTIDRDEHWSEIDADVYSINFMVNYREEIINSLNVSEAHIPYYDKLGGNLADFEEMRQYYSSYENDEQT